MKYKSLFGVDAASPRRPRCTASPKRASSRQTPLSKIQKGRAKSSFVYFLVFKAGHRFKIGKSDSPITRLSVLPEGGRIDLEMSLQLELSSAERAFQVESALHKLMSPYRIQTWKSDFLPGLARQRLQAKMPSTKSTCDDGYDDPDPRWVPIGTPDEQMAYVDGHSRWDGYTEWFNLVGWPLAVRLLQDIALGPEAGVTTGITNLEGQPWYAHDPSLSAEEMRRYVANQVRLTKMQMRLVEIAGFDGLFVELVSTAAPASRAHTRSALVAPKDTTQLAEHCVSTAGAGQSESTQHRYMFPKALYVSRVSDNWSQLATDIKQDLMDPHFWALEGRKGMVQFAKAMVYEDRPAGRVLKIQFHWERAAELTREVMRLYTGRELLGNWQAVCGVMKALGRHTEELDKPVGTLAKATPTSRAPTSAALPTASAD